MDNLSEQELQKLHDDDEVSQIAISLDATPQEHVKQFLDRYFKSIRHVIEIEELFVKELNYSIETNVDYIRLIRFLRTAIRTLQEIDLSFMKGMLDKLFRDANELSNYYNEFVAESKRTTVVFETHFLSSLKPYKYLEDEVSKMKSLRDNYDGAVRGLQSQVDELMQRSLHDSHVASQLRSTKDKLADTIHKYACARDECSILAQKLADIHKAYKEIFIPSFENARGKYIFRFSQALNQKLAILDKLMWVQAQQSQTIEEFFIRSNIQGSFSTKTYISYYIRNIDPDKSADEWHNYLRSVIKEML